MEVVMLARSQNRKSYTLSLHRNANKKMIFECKYFYETSKFQLRSCNIPDEHKTEKNCFETGRKRAFLLPESASSPSQHHSRQRDPFSPQFLPGGKWVKYASNIPSLSGHWMRDLLLSHLTQTAKATSIVRMPAGS